jgi:hypothetical protein
MGPIWKWANIAYPCYRVKIRTNVVGNGRGTEKASGTPWPKMSGSPYPLPPALLGSQSLDHNIVVYFHDAS